MSRWIGYTGSIRGGPLNIPVNSSKAPPMEKIMPMQPTKAPISPAKSTNDQSNSSMVPVLLIGGGVILLIMLTM